MFLNHIPFVWVFIIYLFIFGCAGFLLLLRVSLVAATRGYSLVAVRGLLTVVASLTVEHEL